MKNVDKGRKFEEDVVDVLRLMGYQVAHNELIGGTQTDIVASKVDSFNNLKLIVECGDRDKNIGVDTIREKASILLTLNKDSQFIFRLMYVTKFGFSAEAKAFADSNPQVVLKTFKDIEQNIVDLSPYRNWFIYNYENSLSIFEEGNLVNNYVDLSALDVDQNFIHSVSEEFFNWIDDKKNNLLFVLGEYGSGKTSFARYVSYQMLKNDDFRLPILINLRENKDAFNLRQIITDNLINIYGVSLSNFQAFERLASLGKIIMVLDGFDEMVEKSDSFTIINSFKQIFVLSNLNTKILLTCRTNFFNKHGDIIELFKKYSISLPDSTKDGKTMLSTIEFEKQGKILYIEKLSENQILHYIQKRFSEDAQKILEQIQSIHDLSDLSTRPVLLEMILRSLPELNQANMVINSASLYEHYTNKWSNRDEWRTKLPLEFRQLFCEILAWNMFNDDKDSIEYDYLKLIINDAVGDLSEKVDEQQVFHNDIKTCSFLVRSGISDEFRFAHKSFLEFFVAKKIVADLTNKKSISESKISKGSGAEKMTEKLLAYEYYNLKNHPIWMGTGPATSVSFSRSDHTHSYHLSKYLKSSILDDFDFKSFKNIGTLGSYIESKINVNLKQKHNKVQSLISEEIATFSLEILHNSGTKLDELIRSVKTDDDRNLIYDLIRKSRANELVKANIKKLLNLKREDQQLMLISIGINCLNEPEYFVGVIYPQIESLLNEDYQKCLLFEVAERGNKYSNFLNNYIESKGIDIISKLICYYGLRSTYQKDELYNELETIIRQLLSSKHKDKDSLAIDLIGETGISRSSSIEMLIAIIEDTETDNEIQIRAANALGNLYTPQHWKAVRALHYKIKSNPARKILEIRERQLLDLNSRNLNEKHHSPNLRKKLWNYI